MRDRIYVRRPNDLESLLPRTETEIDVVKYARKMRGVEAVELAEHRGAYRHAFRRNSRAVSLQECAIEEPRMTPRQALVRGARDPADAQQITAVP